ncbi:MAG: FtsQ-type POTRA domain-containing protein [Verrucomicrobia bacterium]|nr:FtsQ-type POTRA domain-containing protein [Verrucomicrobiota bacterium]
MARKTRKKTKYYSKTKPTKGLVARRGLMVLFFVFASMAVLFGVFQLLAYTGSLFFSRNPAFELKNIQIASDGRLTASQLLEYSAVEQGINLFAVDFDTIRGNLESVPLVESVRIQRKLPDTLVIHVVERIATAQIQGKRGRPPFLVDRHGIIMPATRTGQSLPMIEGVKLDELRPGEQVSDAGVQYVLEILTAADSIGLGSQVHFDSFDLRYPEFINARLSDGDVSARFPHHSAREKLIRLVVTLQKAQEMGKRIKTVDLTPDGRNVPTTFY